MRLGVHLPLADLGDGQVTGDHLHRYTRTASDLGYATLAANDHLVWRYPWLDGPTALALVAGDAGDMVLATSISLAVVRHPVVVAKMLTTLAALAPGRVIGGLGPGSSSADYLAVGIPFDERWARFDEALPVVRRLVRGQAGTGTKFYAADSRLAPIPARVPEIWFGSWGSDRRIAAMAAEADGWFASAYNATPDQYRDARARLDNHLRAAGREPDDFPDTIATMWLYVTENRREAEQVLTDVLAPALNRDPAQLANLPIGSVQRCAEILAEYADAGARQVLLWPIRDPLHQLERGMEAAASM